MKMEVSAKDMLISISGVALIIMGIAYGIFAMTERYDNKMVERGYVYINIPAHWEKK
jgi:uncharacterized protein YsxB (DUF464 family)